MHVTSSETAQGSVIDIMTDCSSKYFCYFYSRSFEAVEMAQWLKIFAVTTCNFNFKDLMLLASTGVYAHMHTDN